MVDSDGNTYLLDKLKTKAFIGANYKKEIVVPPYVKTISKVVIWVRFRGSKSWRSEIQLAGEVARTRSTR